MKYKRFVCLLSLLLLSTLILSTCGNQSSDSPSHKKTDFPKVTTPYKPETAAQNGDVVDVHGTLMNAHIWQQFLDNVNKNQEDQVRVTAYTIEGSPIFFELVYDGEIIHYTFDNSMDGFGTYSGRPSTICQGIEIRQNNEGNAYYVFTACDDKLGNTFSYPAN